ARRNADLGVEIGEAETDDLLALAEAFGGDGDDFGRARLIGALAARVEEGRGPGRRAAAERGEKMLHRFLPLIRVLARRKGRIAGAELQLVGRPGEEARIALVDEGIDVRPAEHRGI